MSSYAKMTVAQLKEELKKKGLDTTGKKNDLVERLHCADARVAVAHDGTRRQPLFALYRKDVALSAASALANDLPVWRWQDELHAVDVDFSSAAANFINLNTAADFQRWETTHAI